MSYRLLLIIACFCWLIPNISAQNTTCIGAPTSRLIIGEQAQIIADGGSNLRLRPSVDATLLNVIPQNELIPIIDGPFCAQGYAWWQVDFEGDRGWIAEGTDVFYWLAPYVIQRAQIGTVRIEIQPNLITGIRIERLAEPLRSQFILEGYPVSSNQLVPFIVIFDEAPENIDLASGNAISQLENLDMGLRFVDVLFTEPLEESNDVTIIYHYRAITDDNRFIDAYFPTTAPNLPLAYSISESDIDSYNRQYFEDTVEALATLSSDDFTPTLAQLDGIVRSIQPNAPIEESMLLNFNSSGISFDYNPLFATHITEDIISEDDIPEHMRLSFDNYPIGEAAIRIYSTEDIAGSSLSTFQQILSRQSNNPPQILIPSQANAPLFRDNLSYLNFVNGEGVRYRVGFTEDAAFYSYQGLSENGDYFVSALLLMDDEFPPFSLFDALMQSLQIGE